MGKHERYGLEDILIAASGAGRMGFSATQSALMNLANCSMCPFWQTCDGSKCQLLVPVAGRADAADRAFRAN